MKSLRREAQRLVKIAEKEGWTVRITNAGHYHLTPPNPDGKMLTVGTTPSNFRGLRNFRAALRRQGLEV